MKKRSGGRKSIGADRIAERIEHEQDVYDALYSLETIRNIGKKARVKDIHWFLEEQTKYENKKMEERIWDVYKSKVYNWTKDDMNEQIQKNKKTTISERTIERCLKHDPRIVNEGWTYHINRKARLESRYLRPDWFGHDMLDAVMQGFRFKPSEECMSELIRRFGALVLFNFIEAVRPFKDKSMSLRERTELIDYWAKNALDLDEMLTCFMMTFGGNEIDSKDYTLALNEMEESKINRILETFEKSCPDLYQKLTQARREQTVSSDEETRKTTGNIGFVHGKTYHSGWKDWWAYLKEMDPQEYQEEMERLRKEHNRQRWRY
jgi:hypothetical protein